MYQHLFIEVIKIQNKSIYFLMYFIYSEIVLLYSSKYLNL